MPRAPKRKAPTSKSSGAKKKGKIISTKFSSMYHLEISEIFHGIMRLIDSIGHIPYNLCVSIRFLRNVLIASVLVNMINVFPKL